MIVHEENGIGQRVAVLTIVKHHSFSMGYAQRRLNTTLQNMLTVCGETALEHLNNVTIVL